jgi:hypothetical protein
VKKYGHSGAGEVLVAADCGSQAAFPALISGSPPRCCCLLAQHYRRGRTAAAAVNPRAIPSLPIPIAMLPFDPPQLLCFVLCIDLTCPDLAFESSIAALLAKALAGLEPPCRSTMIRSQIRRAFGTAMVLSRRGEHSFICLAHTLYQTSVIGASSTGIG